MGVLAPLYLAGLAALSVPLVLHLIRRTPRGKQVFSSLMFLSPSPPRLTRRSRLDQILLLLLRLGALALIVLAFTRPFFREASVLALGDLPARKVAFIVDTSASMRRGDLWQQSLRQVEKELADLAPQDEVALFTFTDRLETVVGFSEEGTKLDAARNGLVLKQMQELQPTWATSDLGSALVTLAGELDASGDVDQSMEDPQIIVISDFQRGSQVDALQAFEWPARVPVVTRKLSPQNTTNAYAQLLAPAEESADTDPRVRVVNAADSTGDQFFLRWANASAAPSAEHETAIYVPPGESRVVRLPRSQENLTADRVSLRGDDHEFDNTHYVVPPKKLEVPLLYAGTDSANDPQGLQYYLRLAVSGDPLRQVNLQPLTPEDAESLAGPEPPRLVVVTTEVSAVLKAALQKYVESGGVLMLVPKDEQAAESITQFFDVELRSGSAGGGENDFFLLGTIDFTHPMFAPLANPRYNDFTKIRFWRYKPVIVKDPAAASIVARFDSGDPFIIERAMGNGRVLALTSGWNPDDSQLAVSSKFVPLIGGLLDQAYGSQQALASAVVQQPAPLPADRKSSLVISTPDGRQVSVDTDENTFAATDHPGIYIAAGQGTGTSKAEWRFAVNLAPSESDTAPMDLEQLEQLGVPVGKSLTRAQELSLVRQQRDVELESRQKIWRWLVVACLAFLIVETWWAGRAARELNKPVEAIA